MKRNSVFSLVLLPILNRRVTTDDPVDFVTDVYNLHLDAYADLGGVPFYLPAG